MSLSDRLARNLGDLRMSTFENPSDAIRDVFGGSLTRAGFRVNSNAALSIPAYYAATKILAETMGSMPCEVRQWEGTADQQVHRPAPQTRLWDLLYRRPNPELHAGDFWECITTHLALRGNAYLFKQRDEYGRVIALWPLPPNLVDVQRDLRTRQKLFLVSPDPEAAVAMPFWVDDILHFRGFGPDPLRGLTPIGAMRELLGRALAEQDYASAMMANSGRPGGILRTDKRLDPAKGRRLARRFKRSVGGTHRAGETIVLEEGLQWQQVSLSAGDAQFMEQREFTAKDVARITRVPADQLLVETGGSMHYTSDETSTLRFLTFTMMPWIRRIEGPLSIDEDLPWAQTGSKPGRMFPRFQPDVLNRVNRKERFEAWALALDKGWMTPDEVRVAEGLKPFGLTQTKPLTADPGTHKRELPAPKDEPDHDDVERLLADVLN